MLVSVSEGMTTFLEGTQALTTLDVSFVLAATARWEDSQVVERDALLLYVLEIALEMLAPLTSSSGFTAAHRSRVTANRTPCVTGLQPGFGS